MSSLLGFKSIMAFLETVRTNTDQGFKQDGVLGGKTALSFLVKLYGTEETYSSES